MLNLFILAAVLGTSFWPLAGIILVLYCSLAVLAECEMWGWSSLILIFVLVALGASGVFNLPVWALHHPVTLLWWLGGYLVAGSVWGTFKWWQYCLRQRDLLERQFRSFRANRLDAIGTAPPNAAWDAALLTEFRGKAYTPDIVVPTALDNKERIITWMYLWPFSIVGTLFSDWLLRLFTRIYRFLEGMLDSISASVWKGSSVTAPDKSNKPDGGTDGGKRTNAPWA